MSDSEEKTIEKLTEENKRLHDQIDKRYGLYYNHKIDEEDIINRCINHIPYLNHEADKDIINGSIENILIEGDNFQVLLALSEIYPNGVANFIYIDPPYNTGNKDLQYNDKFVDSEDGFRHSKWLAFMEPRLSLAKTLLKDDGIIYISIDEHEFAQLKLLCDSIFGEQNFVENFIWIKNATKNLSKTTSTNHEYIICYAKNKNIAEDEQIFRTEKPGFNDVEKILNDAKDKGLDVNQTEKMLNDFYKSRKDLKGVSMYDRVDIQTNPKNGDKTYRAFRLSDISAPKATGRAQTYDVIHPKSGLPCKVPTRGWAFTKEKMDENIKNNLIYFYEDEKHVPQFKRFLDTVDTEVVKSTFEDFTDGKKELMKIFDGDAPFSNAKPTTLLKKLLSFSRPDSVILDFFAGSGTTAQAVLELNKEDGGNRKFILCTNNENNIMTDVCYPRIKTILTGIRPNGTKYSDGLSGCVRYFKADFIDDNSYKDSAKYYLGEKCDGLLCILEDCFDEYTTNGSYSIYKNETTNKSLSVYNKIYKERTFEELLNDLEKANFSNNVIYYYSSDTVNDEYIEKKVLDKIQNAIVKPFPSKIYDIYSDLIDKVWRKAQ